MVSRPRPAFFFFSFSFSEDADIFQLKKATTSLRTAPGRRPRVETRSQAPGCGGRRAVSSEWTRIRFQAAAGGAALGWVAKSKGNFFPLSIEFLFI